MHSLCSRPQCWRNVYAQLYRKNALPAKPHADKSWAYGRRYAEKVLCHIRKQNQSESAACIVLHLSELSMISVCNFRSTIFHFPSCRSQPAKTFCFVWRFEYLNCVWLCRCSRLYWFWSGSKLDFLHLIFFSCFLWVHTLIVLCVLGRHHVFCVLSSFIFHGLHKKLNTTPCIQHSNIIFWMTNKHYFDLKFTPLFSKLFLIASHELYYHV